MYFKMKLVFLIKIKNHFSTQEKNIDKTVVIQLFKPLIYIFGSFVKKIHMKLSIPTLQHQIGCPSFTYLQGRQAFPAGLVDVSVIYCHSYIDRGVTLVYAFLLFIIQGLKVNCKLNAGFMLVCSNSHVQEPQIHFFIKSNRS